MAEAVTSAVISDMVSRAISIVVGRTTRHESSEIKLRRMYLQLIKIRSVVEEAMGRQITNHATLDWLSELTDGMYQGLYFLDKSQAGSHDPVVHVDDNKALPHPFVLSPFNPAKRLRVAVAGRIKSLFSSDGSLREIDNVLANLQGLFDDLRQFLMLLESCPPIHKPLSTSIYVDCQMFGRHIERERIINFLLHKDNPSQRELGVLPIIGHVGVGKTTLVQHACDDIRVRSHFSPIVLSDYLSLNMMDSSSEKRVVFHSTYSTDDLKNFKESLQTLAHNLKNKRFLIIFENIDSHNKEVLEVLLSNLRCSKQGSKIIVTSNNNGVARIGTVQPIKLKILPRAEYWFYFKALAFPGADFEENCPRLARIGMAIATKLDGSFFGAKIMGALLRANPNLQFWHEALRSSIWDIPIFGNCLPYISDVANYFLPEHVAMCHINAYTSMTDLRNRTLSRFQDVCLANPLVNEKHLLDDKGNKLNLHVLLCKSVMPFHSVYYVAHCNLRMMGGCGLNELFKD